MASTTKPLTLWSTRSASEQNEAIERAAQALARGELIILPTETVYGVFASAASDAAIAALNAGLDPASPTSPAAWHAHSRHAALDLIAPTRPVHRRAMERLTPGPVTFRVEAPLETLDAWRDRLGARPGTLHDTTALGVRVPDHPAARATLARARELGHPAVAHALAALGAPQGRTANTQGLRVHVVHTIDDGPTALGQPSTTLRLLSKGSILVTAAGAVEESRILDAMTRTILFVCTGNTCRSPMAEAIAHAQLTAKGTPTATTPNALGTRTLSAGTSAANGDRITPEAVVALKSLGIDALRHRSQPVTPEMLTRADVVYAMTTAHLRAAKAIAPAARIELLDPAGSDIEDPIGRDQPVYTATARRLAELIRQRLYESEA